MTEADWLTCPVPRPMLLSLAPRWAAQEKKGAKIDREQLRLFACACCRHVRGLLEPEHLEAVRLAEEHARGTIANGLRAARKVCKPAKFRVQTEYARAHTAVPHASEDVVRAWGRMMASGGVWMTTDRSPGTAAGCYHHAASAVGEWQRAAALGAGTRRPAEDAADKAIRAELACQAELLREIVGNPFRPVTVQPAWLTWNDGAVPKLARAVEDHRLLPEGTLDDGRMAILADALEEAGCDDAELVAHCRGPGPHVLGCWAVALFRHAR